MSVRMRLMQRNYGIMRDDMKFEDDMMKNFEEGKTLVASCTKELESIRQRIEKVVSGNQEPPQVEPLDIV